MARKRIDAVTIEQVLIASRRRCCICYGLEGDLTIKQGQIAHLDRNHANNHLGNLAFLCLNHHDQYDSRTSQSKGWTIQEVKRFQGDLERQLSSMGSLPSPKAVQEEPSTEPSEQPLSPPITTQFVQTREFEVVAEIPIVEWRVSSGNVLVQVAGWSRIAHNDDFGLGSFDPDSFIAGWEGLCYYRIEVQTLDPEIRPGSWLQVRPFYKLRGDVAICPTLKTPDFLEGLYCLCDPFQRLLWRRVTMSAEGFTLTGHKVVDQPVRWDESASYQIVARVVSALHLM